MRALLALLPTAFLATSAPAADVAFSRTVFRGVPYLVTRVDPAALELHWKGRDGLPLLGFDALRRDLARRGRMAVWAMNAGIFMDGGAPLGLHVQGGRTLRPLNTRTGYGNFYLAPNGVVWVKAGRAAILTTAEYARRDPRPDLAVQSGPMLLVGGKVNAAFNPRGPSRLPRNGVGVDGAGRLVFAVTADGGATNFHDFAGLFARLGCRDALYLDGNISAQEGDGGDVPPTSPQYGAFFAVTRTSPR